MSSFVVRSLVSAARGEVAAAAAAALGQLAAAVAINAGALNLLRETREGIRAGRKSIGAQTLAGLVLSALDVVEQTYKEAGALPVKGGASLDERRELADAWGAERGAALLAAVNDAKEARKAAAAARAAEKGSAGNGSPDSDSEGKGSEGKGSEGAGTDPMTDSAPTLAAALARCAAFSAESLADGIAANETARRMLSEALAMLAARDAAAVVAAAADAAAGAGAVVAAAKGRRVAKGEKIAA